jgi:hypothetical protein
MSKETSREQLPIEYAVLLIIVVVLSGLVYRCQSHIHEQKLKGVWQHSCEVSDE